MSSDTTVFFDLLRWLVEQQDLDSRASAIRDEVYDVAVVHQFINEAHLEACVERGSSETLDGWPIRPAIWLPPVTRSDQALPLLTPRWRYAEAFTELRLYVALYYYDLAREQVDALGFRFEQPESLTGAGRHNYWHAQPTPDVARGTTIEASIRAHPESTPAFPLEATTPATLLICLLLSLYGAKFGADLGGSGVDGVAVLMEPLACYQSGIER